VTEILELQAMEPTQPLEIFHSLLSIHCVVDL
jgi:hypothetical protein